MTCYLLLRFVCAVLNSFNNYCVSTIWLCGYYYNVSVYDNIDYGNPHTTGQPVLVMAFSGNVWPQYRPAVMTFINSWCWHCGIAIVDVVEKVNHCWYWHSVLICEHVGGVWPSYIWQPTQPSQLFWYYLLFWPLYLICCACVYLRYWHLKRYYYCLLCNYSLINNDNATCMYTIYIVLLKYLMTLLMIEGALVAISVVWLLCHSVTVCH